MITYPTKQPFSVLSGRFPIAVQIIWFIVCSVLIPLLLLYCLLCSLDNTVVKGDCLQHYLCITWLEQRIILFWRRFQCDYFCCLRASIVGTDVSGDNRFRFLRILLLVESLAQVQDLLSLEQMAQAQMR